MTLKPGSWISAVQPFAFANARIFFTRAVRAALFAFSAGQQSSSRFSKTMHHFRFSRRSRELVLWVRSVGVLLEACPGGRLQMGMASFVVLGQYSKSLTLPRRNSRRASRRGGVVRHPLRQGLLPSDAPPRATACENVAACDSTNFFTKLSVT